jgi:hypothetical protein
MSAGAEVDGIPVEPNQLGEAQAHLGRDQQQGVIAAAEATSSDRLRRESLSMGAELSANVGFQFSLVWRGEGCIR